MVKPSHIPWYQQKWTVIIWIFIGLYFISSASENITNYNLDIQKNNYDSFEQDRDGSVEIGKPIEEETISDELPLQNYLRDKITNHYEWRYGGYVYGISLDLYPEVYNFFRERERTRDYDLFASDFYSKPFIKSLTKELERYGKENGLDDDEIPYFIISFVQSLPYTSDDTTTGFDEYPRFPYETFYDGGGDCEDTSILASAMLYELNYGVALLQFPNHIAVGVKCSPTYGQAYYRHNGIDYCYLETTGKNWDVGDVPPNIRSHDAIVKPIVERPVLQISFTSSYEYNWKDVYTDVDVEVKNIGSKTAENTKIYVALQTTDISKVLDYVQSDSLEIDPEQAYRYKITNLHSINGQSFRVYVRAWGDNAITAETVSEWIYWQ